MEAISNHAEEEVRTVVTSFCAYLADTWSMRYLVTLSHGISSLFVFL